MQQERSEQNLCGLRDYRRQWRSAHQMKLLATLLFFVSLTVGAMACPAGQTCTKFNGSYPYTRASHTTNRVDTDRWSDNWMEFPDVGIDCTGTNDSTTALQAAINAMPDRSTLKAPAGCVVKLSSTITITDRIGITIASDQRPEDNIIAPEFKWSGSNAGPMFSLTWTNVPTIKGFRFYQGGSSCVLTSFLVFDGNGGSGHQTPTDALIEHNSFFNNCNSSAISFSAISIAPTAVNNHENYRIENNDFYCGTSSNKSIERSFEAVTTSGSPDVSAADGKFTSADVGQPILVTWATGSLSTTILTVSDTADIVLNANVSASESNVTIFIGRAYGIGILVGADSNAKDEKIINTRVNNCHYGLYLTNGSYEIRHFSGDYNDTAIYISPSEPSQIAFYQGEFNLRFVEIGSTRQPVTIIDNRGENSKQRADGYFYYDGICNSTVSGFHTDSDGMQTNAVLFGFAGPDCWITSIGNYYHPVPWSQVGLTSATGYISINDVVYSDTVLGLLLGGQSLPTSSSGLKAGQIWNKSGILNVSP